MSYLYVAGTILLTAFGQLIIKWQVSAAGPFPATTFGKLEFIARLLVNPWIVFALLGALGASILWMAAMTRLDLSHAYPFMSLAFVLVVLGSAWFFSEPLTLLKVVGLALVCAGIVIGSQG